MTVPTEVSRVQYTGNGSSQYFPTTFYFHRPEQLKVSTITGGVTTVQVLNVNYGVTMPASVGAGGQIFFADGQEPDVGTVIIIERDVQMVQATNFRTVGDFSPEIHEYEFDELVFMVQENARDIKDATTVQSGGLVAGDGVSFTGNTLNVGQGDGITVGVNSISVAFDAFAPPSVSGANAVAGTVPFPAHRDHTHQVVMGPPVLQGANTGGFEGVSYAAAHADHVHPTATGLPVNVNASARSLGLSGLFSDASHKHLVEVGPPVSITDYGNAEGSGDLLARSGHVHEHGDRGGGTLHALATPSVAGFMSPAQAGAVQALATSGEVMSAGSTSTISASPISVLSWTPANYSTEVITACVAATCSRDGVSNGYFFRFVVRRDGGTTLVGTVDMLEKEGAAPWSAVVSVAASPVVSIVVTGDTGTPVSWNAVARRLVLI